MADHSLDRASISRGRIGCGYNVIATLALCVLTAFGWFLLPAEIRALFTLSQRLTLLGVLAVLILVILALASSYVRADPNGLRVRNGLRVMLCPGAASTRSSSAAATHGRSC